VQSGIVRLIREKGLVPVGEMLHEFPSPGAFTSAILLAESHVTIHTWPEERYVSIDIFVCNMSRDFSGDAEAIGTHIVGLFSPEKTEKSILYR
jgi:S-adenosylmethionine decarboxylase